MSKPNHDMDRCTSPVGVVKRRDVPKIERLLAEQDSCTYTVAIEEFDLNSARVRKWAPMLASVAFFISLLGLSDPR